MANMWKPDLLLLAAPDRSGQNQRTVRDGFWRKIRHAFGKVPFSDDAVAGYFAALDPSTPKRTKLLLFAALAYFVAPADAVPDIIAGLGFTDDTAVFLAAWRMVQDHIRPEHRRKAQNALGKLTSE